MLLVKGLSHLYVVTQQTSDKKLSYVMTLLGFHTEKARLELTSTRTLLAEIKGECVSALAVAKKQSKTPRRVTG